VGRGAARAVSVDLRPLPDARRVRQTPRALSRPPLRTAGAGAAMVSRTNLRMLSSGPVVRHCGLSGGLQASPSATL
jgi:hypothetical protein